ncbi:MAG: hypothetical protein GW903_04700 [Alphaproteobacteria bacterium]|nr:hypothetical protein [Alphaproteobacteria bacterium]NCQ88269.1 hypothetical protein [Alphaproteobacteria bacterium]NCT05224.1 hypothetical protein [Alphaproteobacteria bacterium]
MTKPVTNTVDVAKRIILYLLQDDTLARYPLLASREVFKQQREHILRNLSEKSLTQCYQEALHPFLRVTLNPNMPDNIYIEVSGKADEKEAFFEALELLDARLKQALGKSGKSLIIVDIPEIEPQALKPMRTRAHNPSNFNVAF